MMTALPDLEEVTFPEVAIPCEATWTDPGSTVLHKCKQDATWVVRTRCHCGHVEIDLLCEDHYRIALIVRGKRRSNWGFVCTARGCVSRVVDVHGEPL